MNTIEKLDHANWIRNILKATENKPTLIYFNKDNGSFLNELNFAECDHHTVKIYRLQLEELVSNMRHDLQKELEGYLK